MMSVDGYLAQNGRQFCAMRGWDDEMDRMARTPKKKSTPIDCCDLLGRRYTQEGENNSWYRQFTTDSQQHMEDEGR
jgi:hypothetical protein